jgi:RepB DNA-primase from phage plasmid
MVLYIQIIDDYGTLLRSICLRVKSKKQMTTISTLEAVEKQIRAMSSKAFEIGLFDPHATQGAMLPRVWGRDTLLRSVSWLRLKNAEGRNIYIRPAGEHCLSLLDDASIQVIERLKSEGFAPAVVLETSPGNFQAWLHHGQILPKALSTLAARLLASRFGGDLASADWRHYGRLAGFTNRKGKYRKTDGNFPYVRLHEATGVVYSRAVAFLEEVKALYKAEESRLSPRAYLNRRSPCRSNLKSIEEFRAKSIYGGDHTREDLAYAVYALAHGVPESEARSALASRDLTHKGDKKRQQDYIDRTIEKARERIVDWRS